MFRSNKSRLLRAFTFHICGEKNEPLSTAVMHIDAVTFLKQTMPFKTSNKFAKCIFIIQIGLNGGKWLCVSVPNLYLVLYLKI